jgi:hypothetical protein
VVSVVALVAVISCAVVAASVAAWSGAQVEIADARGRRAVGVNAALSGVEGVAAEVARQRRELLRGAALQLSASVVLWQGKDAGGQAESGVVRVVPIGPGGRLFEAEAAKLDVNEVSAQRLRDLGVLTAGAAQTALDGRAARAWGSVWELLEVEPAWPSPAARVEQAATPRGDGPSEDVRDMASASGWLTCYSADPQERSGFSADGAVNPDATGAARRVLPEIWTEGFEAALAKDVGGEGAAWLGRLYAGRGRPAAASALAAAAGVDRVDPAVAAAVLDGVEFDDAGTRRGLVDLMTAGTEVLSGVPGIAPSVADRIVAAREKLEPSRRATPLWPVLEGLVEMNEFAPALDFVVSRCLVFRVVVEGGVVRGELRGDPSEWVVRDRWAYEVIIDASEAPVRIAYLRACVFDGLSPPGGREVERGERREQRPGASEAEAEAEPGNGPERIETPRVEMERIETPRVETERVQTARPDGGGGAVDSATGRGADGGAAARTRIGRWRGVGGGGGGGSGSGAGSGGSSGP